MCRICVEGPLVARGFIREVSLASREGRDKAAVESEFRELESEARGQRLCNGI